MSRKHPATSLLPDAALPPGGGHPHPPTQNLKGKPCTIFVTSVQFWLHCAIVVQLFDFWQHRLILGNIVWFLATLFHFWQHQLIFGNIIWFLVTSCGFGNIIQFCDMVWFWQHHAILATWCNFYDIIDFGHILLFCEHHAIWVNLATSCNLVNIVPFGRHSVILVTTCDFGIIIKRWFYVDIWDEMKKLGLKFWWVFPSSSWFSVKWLSNAKTIS